MNQNEKIGLVLRIEGSEQTIDAITEIELALKRVRDGQKGLAKSYKEGQLSIDEYETTLKASKQTEEDLIQQRRATRTELNKSIKDFKKFGRAIDENDTSIEGMQRRYSKLRKELRLVPKEIRNLASDVVNLDSKMDGVDQETKDAVNSFIEMRDEAKRTKAEINEFGLSINDFTSNIGNYQSAFAGVAQSGAGLFSQILGGGGGASLGLAADAIGGITSTLGPFGVAFSATIGLVATAGDYIIGVTKQFEELQNRVTTTTGLIGDDLDNAVGRIKGLADTFDKDFNEVLVGAQNLAKGFGISFDESLDLINTGLLSGADLNGDFLRQLEEYPVQLANAGFSAEEFIKIATQQVKGGIFDDKLIDTLKESDLALTEFTKTQRDALTNVLGEDATESFLSRIRTGSLTTKDAILEISDAVTTAGGDLQDIQQITADVFKGAGEDAGGFGVIVENVLTALNTEYEDLVDTTDAYVIRQNNLLKANTDLANEQNRLTKAFAGTGLSMDILGQKAQKLGLQLVNDVAEAFRVNKKILEDRGFIGALKGGQELYKEYLDDINTSDELAAKQIKTQEDADKALADSNARKQREIEKQAKFAKEQREKIEKENAKAAREAEREQDRLDKAAEKRIETEKKAAEQAQKNRESASSNISNLDLQNQKAGLDASTDQVELYLLDIERLKLKAEQDIKKLVGDKDQIDEQTRLINDTLDVQINNIETKIKDFNETESLKVKIQDIDEESIRRQTEAIQRATNALSGVSNENVDLSEPGSVTDENSAVNIAANNAAKQKEIEANLQAELTQIVLEGELERLNARLGGGNLEENERLQLEQDIANKTLEIEKNKNASILEDQQQTLDRQNAFAEQALEIQTTLIESVGDALGNFLVDQEEGAKDFLKAILVLSLDALEKQILLSVASATAQSFAQADSVATFGATGAIRAGILASLIKAGFSVVKSAIGTFEGGGDLSGMFKHQNRVSFPAQTGGLITGPSHKNGGVKFMSPFGLAEAEGNEVILNQAQQLALVRRTSPNVFHDIGVPGARNRHNGIFMGGGFVPSNVKNSDVNQTIVNVKVEISDEDVERIGQSVRVNSNQNNQEIQRSIKEGIKEADKEIKTLDRLRGRSLASSNV